MVNTLISANIKKYLLMLNNGDKISYYEIDQLCSSTDKTLGYIRKIVLTIPDIIDKTYKSGNQKYCKNVIKLRYLNEEFHLINKTALNLMTQLSIEYNDLYETIRYISNIEDIDREYADIQKRTDYAKNEKIAESKRVEDLHSKCADTLGMSDKKIKDTRLKLREHMSNR